MVACKSAISIRKYDDAYVVVDNIVEVMNMIKYVAQQYRKTHRSRYLI